MEQLFLGGKHSVLHLLRFFGRLICIAVDGFALA